LASKYSLDALKLDSASVTKSTQVRIAAVFLQAELRKSHPLHIGIYQWLHSSEVENWHFLSQITQATKVFCR